jgi:hypothetical protein
MLVAVLGGGALIRLWIASNRQRLVQDETRAIQASIGKGDGVSPIQEVG